jgi:glycosyltransferase involved in cell wall biosynthesis
MACSFLCGILDADTVVAPFLGDQDRCRSLYRKDLEGIDNGEDLWARLGLGETWRPDFFLLRLGLAPVPPWIWSLPVPIVAVVEDLECLWHHHRLCLVHCALAFAEPESAVLLQRAGVQNVRPLGGLSRLWECSDSEAATNRQSENCRPEFEIKTDVLLVGLPHPHLERDSLARLRTWARLGERYRVLCVEATKEELAQHIPRSRVVLLRGKQRDKDRIEAYARNAGTVVLREEETSPVALGRFLDQEGNVCLEACTIGSQAVWDQLLATAEKELLEGATKADLSPRQATSLLLARCRHLLVSGPSGDVSLIGDLTRRITNEPDNATLYVALGLALIGYARSQAQVTAVDLGSALEEFRQALAVAPSYALARLNFVEALVSLGEKETAANETRIALTLLDRLRDEDLLLDDAGHFPVGQALSSTSADGSACPTDEFSLAWERAAMQHVGRPQAGARAKKDLIAWRLHQLLGDLTGANSHYFEAALANGDSPTTRAALGSALARAGKVAHGTSHLRWAVQHNPLDLAAARNLYHALGQADDELSQRRLAREMWLLTRMIPALAREPWFDNAPPAGDELASIILFCSEEVQKTRACLDSLLRHTHTPFEIILVDLWGRFPTCQGRSGQGGGLLHEGSYPYLKHFQVLQSETSRDGPAAWQEALERAKGEYLVLLEGATLVTEGWLERMIACALAEWPRVGMVGPVSNIAASPQLVRADSEDMQTLAALVRRHVEYEGKACPVEQLEGFCLLLRRETYEVLAPSGDLNYEEWCRKARQAGFELLVALDVYVHRCPVCKAPSSKSREEKEHPEPITEQVNEQIEETDRSVGECRDSRKAVSRPPVSLCMIVKNEENNLPACLASVAGLTDEIVIVDTGSTDRTKEVALQAGAKVFDFPWVDDFAAARNESIRHATGEWVFWMDADDRLDEDNRQKLRRLLADLPKEATSDSMPGNMAFVMKCLCLPDHQTGTATVVDHVRLFRNDPRIRWKYRIHEQILWAIHQVGGQARWSDIVIQHTGYQDAACIGPKLERSVRLLQMDLADNPHDPFTLFNLGWTFLKMGRLEEALPYLESSLQKSQAGDSIVRKTYALLVECHKGLGHLDQALETCRRGRRIYPDDAEILFEEGCLYLDRDNLTAAESLFTQLVERKPGTYFASVDPALHGYKSRHCLGAIYHKQKRYTKAVSEWQKVLAVRADYLPTLLCFGELYIERQDWARLDELVESVECLPGAKVEAVILRAQGHMARQEFASAKNLLEEARQQFPQSLLPRVVLSHALLQEGHDLEAAEVALREVLTMDPNHLPTRHNLRVLMHKRGACIAS